MASTGFKPYQAGHNLAAEETFNRTVMMPKWTVMVDGRELPARPLMLEAAGVPPNDPTIPTKR